MHIGYLVAPFVAWVVAGTLKFLINSLRAGRAAVDEIGYGGLPSTHTTIVTTMAALVALREGVDTPAFGVAVTLAFIVVMDAMDLRRKLEGHARAVNAARAGSPGFEPVRERLGHRPVEVAAGIATGIACAVAIRWSGL